MLCFPHSASPQPSSLLCSCSGYLYLSALYTLYFTLLCSIFTPLYSRLLCIASFLYITLLRFASFCTIALYFPYFSWSSFRSDFNFASFRGVARPPIPCSTCFVEPRVILLPLIPLCSVSREPGALEKSEPDWRRYVIYSRRAGTKRSAGRPSDFTQCILIADLTLRLVSKINLKNRLNAKSREGKRRNLIVRHNGSSCFSPVSASFFFHFQRFSWYFLRLILIFRISFCHLCLRFLHSFSHVFPRATYFLWSIQRPSVYRFVPISACAKSRKQFEISLILDTYFIVNATLPSNKQYDFHPPCNSRLYGDGAATLLPSCASPFSPSHPFTPTRLARDHHSRLIIKVWRHRVFSINIPG